MDFEDDMITETVVDPTTINTIDPGIDPTKLVATTRRVQVKLTADKLMDEANGIPYLAKTAKKHLRISKSKPALDNLNNIVKFYQIWAHRAFPRAKFKDFIELSRQLGKKDRILRDYRMSLIRKDMGIEPIGEDDIVTSTLNTDITNPNTSNIHDHELGNSTTSAQDKLNAIPAIESIANSTIETLTANTQSPIDMKNSNHKSNQTENVDNLLDDDDDLYHIAQSTSPIKPPITRSTPSPRKMEPVHEMDQEIDDLMNEQFEMNGTNINNQISKKAKGGHADGNDEQIEEEDDELVNELMNGQFDMNPSTNNDVTQNSKTDAASKDKE